MGAKRPLFFLCLKSKIELDLQVKLWYNNGIDEEVKFLHQKFIKIFTYKC